MGIAERFKNNVNENDLFKKDIEKQLKNKDITFISKPIETPQNTDSNNSFRSDNDNISDFDILTSIKKEILRKIKNTPYWNEFSNVRKEQMITSYFDVKLKKSDKTYSKNDIKEILINTTK